MYVERHMSCRLLIDGGESRSPILVHQSKARICDFLLVNNTNLHPTLGLCRTISKLLRISGQISAFDRGRGYPVFSALIWGETPHLLSPSDTSECQSLYDILSNACKGRISHDECRGLCLSDIQRKTLSRHRKQACR